MRIEAGQVLTARSAYDHDCVYRVAILKRVGWWAWIRGEGREQRVKIYADAEGREFIMALGRHSFAPVFRAPVAVSSTEGL